MAVRTGKVILAKGIKLEKTYKDILDYSESQMVTLLQSKAVGTFNNCSFIRQGENAILVEIPYGDALKANYIGFQNPDYSNKWFFGFIDEVEYISDKTTRINYTIDECATWYDYWTARKCFVVREHTNDDTFGSNTIPEGIETGEFVRSLSGKEYNYGGQFWLVFQVTELISNMADAGTGTHRLYNGVYSGLRTVLVDDYTTADLLVSAYDDAGKADSIVACFYIPKDVVTSYITNAGAVLHGTTCTIYFPRPTTSASTLASITVDKPTTIDGYVPRNNKLFTGEFCYMVASNNSGADAIFKFEDWRSVGTGVSLTTATFLVRGALSQGGNIRMVPNNEYKVSGQSGSASYTGFSAVAKYGITAGKLPICSWNSDYYTNWLTQNAVNIGLNNINTAVGAVSNFAQGDIIGGAMSLINGIGQNVAKQYQAEMVPNQAKGNTNCGDFNFSENLHLSVVTMNVRAEYAKIIDDWFTMFGYKTSRLKVPNQTGRRYWNYVQIAEGESIGDTVDTISVPSASMDIINTAYQRGVTIWHDHANIGNYNLDNTII